MLLSSRQYLVTSHYQCISGAEAQSLQLGG